MISRVILFVLINVELSDIVHGEVYRLPKSVRPVRYMLTVEPYLRVSDGDQDIAYSGSVMIELEILENTKSITLHKQNLQIDENSIKIVDSDRNAHKLTQISANEDENSYTIHMEDELIKHKNYTLKINNFFNMLRLDGLGFFKAFYTVFNETRILAATHFQPNAARMAFPCFDEPALKAKFIVSVIRANGFHSLSNEELESTEDLGNGRFKDTFKETHVMSTYTLAFTVSQYDSVSLEKVKIFSRPALINDSKKVDFALSVGVKALHALEDYTGLDMVIKKMDIFTIPDWYFNYYAMENWGLLIFGESYLLNEYDNADYSQRTVLYLAHEIAHQWFGNLVTPEWWDCIWLSESFAAYFEYYIADFVKPSWRLKDIFVVDVVHEAFRKEERLNGGHPLNYPVVDPSEFPPYHIMYAKGSSIIRMMEHFLTPEIFKSGLKIYLNENKFQATSPSDLYAALQKSVDESNAHHLNNMTVKEIMVTWDSNKGFPIIIAERNYENGSISIRQTTTFDNNTTWIVPINFVFSSHKTIDFATTHAELWLTTESTTVSRSFPIDGWFLVNKQLTGYYRVTYDFENWKRIIESIKTDKDKIHVLNRAQLLEDSFYLAYHQIIPWNVALYLGEYMKFEGDYIELAAFTNAVFHSILANGDVPLMRTNARDSIIFHDHPLMATIHATTTELDLLKVYLRKTLSGVMNYLGTSERPNDTHLDGLSRSLLIQFYYYIGN